MADTAGCEGSCTALVFVADRVARLRRLALPLVAHARPALRRRVVVRRPP